MPCCKFWVKIKNACTKFFTRNHREKTDEEGKYIKVDDQNIPVKIEEPFNGQGLCEILIDSIGPMLTTRLAIEYGEYFILGTGIRPTQKSRRVLAREIARMQRHHYPSPSPPSSPPQSSPLKTEQAWQRRDLDWDAIIAKIGVETIRLKEYLATPAPPRSQYLQPIAPRQPPPTPYLDQVKQAVAVTGIPLPSLVDEIRYHAEKHRPGRSEMKRMIRRCEWGPLAIRIVKDRQLVERFFDVEGGSGSGSGSGNKSTAATGATVAGEAEGSKTAVGESAAREGGRVGNVNMGGAVGIGDGLKAAIDYLQGRWFQGIVVGNRKRDGKRDVKYFLNFRSAERFRGVVLKGEAEGEGVRVWGDCV